MFTSIFSSPIVQDLIRLHNERVKFYKNALYRISNLELDIKNIFNSIIEESIRYCNQLTDRFHTGLDGLPGEIYEKWVDTRVSLEPADKKSILANCSKDELAVLNAYSNALMSPDVGKELEKLLREQQHGLKDLYTHIRQYHDAQ